MYSRFRLAQKYLYYYLTASNGKGHGIHSPFVYDFVRTVLNDTHEYPDYRTIAELRWLLRQIPDVLEIEDMGAGSALQTIRQRSIGDIARYAAKPARLGELLYRVAARYRPSTIVELGTSLGLSAAYLASGSPQARMWTLEGAGAVADIAATNLRSLGLSQVEVVRGHFDQTLPGVLNRTGPVDLAFIDGNHRKEPTLRYFNALMIRASSCSVLIFDDIHWSREMEEAWTLVRADPRVMLTIDLFFLGFVFIRDEFKIKQDFNIRY